jgi:hypothetical protein
MKNFTDIDLINLRLYNTGLTSPRFGEVTEAVSSLGAVQAQDFAMAIWALGLRVKNSTSRSIEEVYDEGDILRVHIMRPTWHFVAPEDIRWMLELTSPRVKMLMSSTNRRIGLDDKILVTTNKVLVNALRDHKYLTRREIKTTLANSGIQTDVQRLAHILAWAELESLICSGPRRGKQFTYALLDERVPRSKKLAREEALAKLAQKYFTSHGPAQLEDFSWWSGLSFNDAKGAIECIQSNLEQVRIEGKNYLFIDAKQTMPKPPEALLLSLFDEYSIAYKDRSYISEGNNIQKMLSAGTAVNAVVVINGKVAGTWKKSTSPKNVNLIINPFRTFNNNEQEASNLEAARFGKFFNLSEVIAYE